VENEPVFFDAADVDMGLLLLGKTGLSQL
jgi:hypothetical protein